MVTAVTQRLFPGSGRLALFGTLGVLATLILSADAWASTERSSKPTCRSGKTLFHKSGVRAFVVVRMFVDRDHPRERSPYKTFYVCGRRSHKPRVIEEGDPFTRTVAYGFRLFGLRLGFVTHSEGFSNGSDTRVGWLDLRIGQLRTGLINAGENAEPGDPTVLDGYVTYAIASDGTVAIMGSEEEHPVAHSEQEVDLLALESRSLGPPRQLFATSNGGLVPGSIGITETSVTWTTTTGQTSSAPR
jgi:hypothetical protein